MNGGERYAVGLWVNDWPAGHASAQLVHIIVQERPFVHRSCQRLLLVIFSCRWYSRKTCIIKQEAPSERSEG